MARTKGGRRPMARAGVIWVALLTDDGATGGFHGDG